MPPMLHLQPTLYILATDNAVTHHISLCPALSAPLNTPQDGHLQELLSKRNQKQTRVHVYIRRQAAAELENR